MGANCMCVQSQVKAQFRFCEGLWSSGFSHMKILCLWNILRTRPPVSHHVQPEVYRLLTVSRDSVQPEVYRLLPGLWR